MEWKERFERFVSRNVKNSMELGKYNGHNCKRHTLFWDRIKSYNYPEVFCVSGHSLSI